MSLTFNVGFSHIDMHAHNMVLVCCCMNASMEVFYTGMFPVGDTSSGTLMPYVCVCVCVCVSQSVSQSVSLSADISLYCAKNDLTDYPEIVWVC